MDRIAQGAEESNSTEISVSMHFRSNLLFKAPQCLSCDRFSRLIGESAYGYDCGCNYIKITPDA